MSDGRQFLTRLGPVAASRLLAAGSSLQLERGECIIRRGEKGGGLYVIQEGSLEIVDDRFRPEVVLDVVAAGDVVGDVSFVDPGPRSADVRAATAARVCLLRQDILRALLERDAEVGAAFYRALTERMAERHRELASAAVLGGLGHKRGSLGPEPTRECNPSVPPVGMPRFRDRRIAVSS